MFTVIPPRSMESVNLWINAAVGMPDVEVKVSPGIEVSDALAQSTTEETVSISLKVGEENKQRITAPNGAFDVALLNVSKRREGQNAFDTYEYEVQVEKVKE